MSHLRKPGVMIKLVAVVGKWSDKLKRLFVPQARFKPSTDPLFQWALVSNVEYVTDRDEIATVAAAVVMRELAAPENRAKGSVAAIAEWMLSTPEVAQTVYNLSVLERFSKVAQYLEAVTDLALEKLKSSWNNPESLVEQPIVHSFYYEGGVRLLHDVQRQGGELGKITAQNTVMLVAMKLAQRLKDQQE
jgi:hypothetical protein